MYKIKKLKDCATIIAGQSPESKYYNTEGIGILWGDTQNVIEES